jgi:Family of unknown function (DUF6011)/SWIM zinc finger
MRSDHTPQATTCTRCGRTLSAAASRKRGMGATCARRDRAEAQYKTAQVEKAREVLELGAIARTPIRTAKGRRVFVVIASSGTDRYLVTVTACTCPAGLKGRRCYHRLSVVLAA